VLNDATLAAAVVWLLALILASLTVRRWAGPWMRAHPVLAVAGAAAVARAVPIVMLDRGLPFDIEAHWWIGSLALAGRDVYTDPLAQGRYPYPPLLHEYLSALLVWLSQGDRALFLALDKLAPALCGVAIAVAVRALARRLGRAPDESLRLGLLYAVNPLPVLVTAYHGQFEEIPILGIVLALLVLLPGASPSPTVREEGRTPWRARPSDARLGSEGLGSHGAGGEASSPSPAHRERGLGGEGPWQFALSALLLGLAIAYKLWPALFLPPLLLTPRWGAGRTRARALLSRVAVWACYGALALTPLVVSMGVYEAAFEHGNLLAQARQVLTTHGALSTRIKDDHMLYNTLTYKGSSGFCWGYVSVAGKCWDHVWLHAHHPNPAGALNGRLLAVALLVVVLALLWRRRPLEGLVALPFAFYLFSPGWGPNYMIWALPFVLLLSAPLAARYTAVVTPLVALTYLDSLYAAFNHDNFSWTVLKPIEGALGLLTWAGVAALLVQVYRVGGAARREAHAVPDSSGHRPVEEPAYYPVYGAQTGAR